MLQRYQQVRKQSIQICQTLKTEDYVVQPVAFVSPPKWNLAHTTWFFEEFLLKNYQTDYPIYSPDYAYFFNSYYNTVGERVNRVDRGNMTRPSTDEVLAYRDYVDLQVASLLESDIALPSQAWEVLELGLQHEQQHQELMLSDIKYILGHNPLLPALINQGTENTQSPNALQPLLYREIPEGLYPIGFQGEGFCFDNEKSAHQVYLLPFRIANRLISNAEYLDFMEDGGYSQFKFWLSDGWEWVQQNQVKSPLYWFEKDGEWYHYSLRGGQKLDPLAPVTHISFYEAEAYARWAGKRLASEFEWETACRILNPVFPKQANFLESGCLCPQAYNGSHDQMLGDTWEWTYSAYIPYPKYKTAPGALGEYNGKFMINQMVLKGGSCATPRSHIRISYRNFFYPSERWQFTGIRLAEYL